MSCFQRVGIVIAPCRGPWWGVLIRTGFARDGTVPSKRTERGPGSGAWGNGGPPRRPALVHRPIEPPGFPWQASWRAVLRQGLWAPAQKNYRGPFSGVVMVVVVILLVHAIPETCAEGFSWSTPRRRGGVCQLSSVLQESVPSPVEHGPGGTRCRQRLAAARRHDCAGAPTGALGGRELRRPGP